MIVKYFIIFIPVLILAFINCQTCADSEPDTQPKLNPEKTVNEDSNNNQKKNGDVILPKIIDDANKTNSSSTNKTSLISCILGKPDVQSSVEIVNVTRLTQVLKFDQNVTHRWTPGTCVAVLFYSPSCPFSCLAAPHFNALPKFFPGLKMIAFDAIQYRGFNAQYGIFGTPTLMLFHGGRPAVKFNKTSDYRLGVFANFITKHTGIKPVGELVITLGDFEGPVPSVPAKETDYYLLLSWIVIAARILYSFYYSTWGRSLVDATLNAWREAEAQHHHAE